MENHRLAGKGPVAPLEGTDGRHEFGDHRHRVGAVVDNQIGGVDAVWGFSVDLLEHKPEWNYKNFYQFQHR